MNCTKLDIIESRCKKWPYQNISKKESFSYCALPEGIRFLKKLKVDFFH
jgi:hypothetical protein